MARLGTDTGIEVSRFVGPRDESDLVAAAPSADGPAFAGPICGSRQLRCAIEDVVRAIEDVVRAIEAGILSFLVADPGLLEVLAGAQARSELPAETAWKVSAYLAPKNPVTFAELERLGASTIDVSSDMTLAQLAELPSLSELPIDLYVGGHEPGEQFGLRNSRALHLSGVHLRNDVAAIAREKVHRAAVGLEWLSGLAPGPVQSGPGAKGLGEPIR